MSPFDKFDQFWDLVYSNLNIEITDNPFNQRSERKLAFWGECYPFFGNTDIGKNHDRLTDQPTDRPTEQQTEIKGHKEVQLLRILEANGHLFLTLKKWFWKWALCLVVQELAWQWRRRGRWGAAAGGRQNNSVLPGDGH